MSSETTPLKKESTTADADAKATTPSYPTMTAILLVMLAIGVGIAYGILSFQDAAQRAAYDSKIAIVRATDLQWLYLGLVVLGRTISMLNFVPTSYKGHLKGNIRSNPFFFQTVDAAKTLVVFKDDGLEGMYNRSNRSVQHMVENAGTVFAAVGPVGWLLPKPTFWIICVFCAGRIVHQKGYSTGYGSHALGFVLSLIGILTLEGLALIAFLQAEHIV